jgi:hypothetical protein
VEWTLEEQMHNWDVLWDYGALTALTDCLYRSDIFYIIKLKVVCSSIA